MTGREQKRAELLAAVSRYRDGRFTASGSGGASGMVTHMSERGEFYVGSLQEPHATQLVTALNLTMDLLEKPRT